MIVSVGNLTYTEFNANFICMQAKDNWQGDWDVLSCFGLDDDVCEYEDGKDVDEYMDAMGLSLVTKAAYHDARGDFLRIAYEKGWY